MKRNIITTVIVIVCVLIIGSVLVLPNIIEYSKNLTLLDSLNNDLKNSKLEGIYYFREANTIDNLEAIKNALTKAKFDKEDPARGGTTEFAYSLSLTLENGQIVSLSSYDNKFDSFKINYKEKVFYIKSPELLEICKDLQGKSK